MLLPLWLEYEFFVYTNETGDIDEEVYEKLVQSIVHGQCPHVIDKVPDIWLKDTSVSGAQIAVVVDTEQAENENNESA